MKQLDSPQFVFHSALRFFSGTCLSKVSGMLRDIAMAYYFGTTPSIASFLIAFRFVYLARRLFGEGLLHQGFIPHFEKIWSEDKKSAALFFRDLFWNIVIFLLGMTLLTGGILYFFHGEINQLAIRMLPGVFFICLFGFCTGLLQSQKSFFIPAAAPIASNIIWILGVFLLKEVSSTEAVLKLAWILSFAFFLQWSMTLPKTWSFLKSHLYKKELFKVSLFSREIRLLCKPVLLGLIGVASVQVNSALDGIFGRFASSEGPAYLWYAIRLQQLPLSLFGIALSSALLPPLSRAHEQKDREQFFSLLTFSKERAIALVLPCVVGIFVLGLSSVNLLFGRGDFGLFATTETTLCLWCYGIGLLPMVLTQIYAQTFYAQKDYHTPMRGFVYAAILNIILNSIFVLFCKMDVASIALATSISAIFNFFYLSQKCKYPKEKRSTSFHVGVSSVLSGLIVINFGYWILGDNTLHLWAGNFPRELIWQMIHFFSQVGVFFVCFFLFCRIFHIKNLYVVN